MITREELREYLRKHKITNLATEAFTKEWEKTIAITAYAETKEESRLLDKYIANTNASEYSPGDYVYNLIDNLFTHHIPDARNARARQIRKPGRPHRAQSS